MEVEKRCVNDQGSGTAWAEVKAEIEQKEAIAQKVNRKAARNRSRTGNVGEQGIGSIRPQRFVAQSTPGIAALEAKANRNPN
jgi:hypothetical protein